MLVSLKLKAKNNTTFLSLYFCRQMSRQKKEKKNEAFLDLIST